MHAYISRRLFCNANKNKERYTARFAKPLLLWFDYTSGAQDPELRVICANFFLVARSSRFERAAEDIERLKPSALCFDFDDPDKPRLQTMQDVKKAHPRLPILMLTTTHSESLAVWAFRARVWNYLVKPVALVEFTENVQALAQIARRGLPPRVAHLLHAHMPIELSVEPIDLGVARLQPALHYVKTHFHEQLSAVKAASLCGTTRFDFSRSFHAAIGMTFREYAMRARIAEARRLLTEGCSSITEVAYATGFTDGSHFARMFKRYTRVLPSEYRASRALGLPTAVQSAADSPAPRPAIDAPAP